MPEMTKLKPGAIKVGEPLLHDVFDEGGNLLLRQGVVVGTREQLDKLYQRGMYQDVSAAAAAAKAAVPPSQLRRNPFEEFPLLINQLKLLLSHITEKHEDSGKRLQRLAREIRKLSLEESDACIALVHFHADEPTAYEQTLFHAFLAERLGRRLELPEEHMESLVMAALTANLALLPHLDRLNQINRALNDEQRAVLNKHPGLSAQALMDAGVRDQRCFDAILQHHENFDGSGYPSGLVGTQICTEARILAIAERYTAMVNQRAYRPRMAPGLAQERIAEAGRQDPDQAVYAALVAELTPYPPGALVLLANEELAVVTHRSEDPQVPRVRAVVSPKGLPYGGAFLRDCRKSEYRIVRSSPAEQKPAIGAATLWEYA